MKMVAIGADMQLGRKVTVASQSAAAAAAATATKFQLLLLLQLELKLLVSAVAASLDFFMCDSCFMLQFSALVFISSAKFIAICQGACLACNSPHLVSRVEWPNPATG